MKMLRFPQIPGMSMADAIVAARMTAHLNGFNGYDIVCPHCLQNVVVCMGHPMETVAA